jgi:hypothetical protein
MSRRAKESGCPSCGSSRVLTIVYGLPPNPSVAGSEEARREGVVFGGCCIEPNSPTHQCASCDHRWIDRRRERAVPPEGIVQP